MEFAVRKGLGPWFGLLVGTAIFAFTLWGINYALTPDDKALRLMLYIPTCIFLAVYIFFLIGAFNLNYWVDEEKLTIRWSLMKKIVYWQDFKEIIIVQGQPNFFPFLSIQWPGFILGLFTIKGLGPVRMYGTNLDNELLYFKTDRGFLGLTPLNMRLADFAASKTALPVTRINMDDIPREVKGVNYREDDSYKLFYRLNLILLAIYILFVVIFYPGSSADPITVLLLVLAIPLFLFNVSNASRLMQFSELGAYIMLVLSLLVTGIFFILTVGEIFL